MSAAVSTDAGAAAVLDASRVPRVRVVREPRLVRVALAGCGSVGGALVRLLASDAGRQAAARAGLRFELAGVLVRNVDAPRAHAPPRELLTADLDKFLSTIAGGADVVVEAIGGLAPAGRIARAALTCGRRLVTANKALVAAHGPALARLAERNRRAGAALDFEAAVCGGVPVVRTLRESLGGVGVTSVCGILNGTTNHVLTRLAEGVSFDGAVREAQAMGFAEADPTRDLSGRDPADKLALLAWIAFGSDPSALRVDVRGIERGAEVLSAAAAALGGTLRLIASARAEDGIVHASVLPTVVPADSAFARVTGEENLVVIHSESSGPVRLGGRGAGGDPTAAALFADLLRPAAPLHAHRKGPVLGTARLGGTADGPGLRNWVLVVDERDADAVRRAVRGRGVFVGREVRVGGMVVLVTSGTPLDVVEAAVASSGVRRARWGLARQDLDAP
ncbi:MAG: metX hom [Gemmatimonadetes bacterium]|nr:metX hom [Gemmatimonadota bacterium]